tara:strand:- start:154 stop:531 length:378 start_codon:yes stop_codon:yes gene_type:complete
MPDRGQYAPVIAIFIKQIREGKSLTVVGDGLQKRDFIYVQDVVSANIKAALSDESTSGQIYNVGSGTNISILEIAKSFQSPYKHIPPREGEARNTLANISKIKRNLDWTPTVSVEDWIQRWREAQ